MRLLRLLTPWAWALLGAATACSVALAQPPADVGADLLGSDVVRIAVDLPPPPPGFSSETRSEIRWTYPTAAASEVEELMVVAAGHWSRLERDFGAELGGPLEIRIGVNPAEMAELAPRGFPPPSYASGVAYGPFGLILLSLTAPATWQRPDMEALLVHELTHVALHRAVSGKRLPRWFNEGLAIYEAGEYSLARTRVLWEATTMGQVLPLDELSASFPNRPHRVSVAYAQSADFVAYMRRDAKSEEYFAAAIGNMREGTAFEAAILDAYGSELSELERSWRATLTDRFHALPLVLGGSGIWVIAFVVIGIGYMRKRRRNKKKLAQWEEEERTIAPPVVLAIPVGRHHLSASGANPSDPPPRRGFPSMGGEATESSHDDADRPSGGARPPISRPGEPRTHRDSDVPTVVVEGESHTLH